jgi:outer membrane protein OmpA-like peptidoglycan-associated protein
MTNQLGFEIEMGEVGEGLLGELLDRLESGASRSAEAPPIPGGAGTVQKKIKAHSPDTVVADFPFGKSEFVPRVPQDAQTRVEDPARVILSGTVMSPIVLIGHTDPVGSRQLNFDLGKRRAQTIRRMLDATLERMRKGSSRGISYDIQSAGATQPVMPNDLEKHRALNRRVEVLLIYSPGGVPLPGWRIPWVSQSPSAPPRPESRPP